MSHEHLSFQEMVALKRKNRMARVDAMEPEMRELVHEYGLSVVTAFVESGMSNPKRIRHVVEVVLNEFSPTRGSYSIQGRRIEQNG